MTVGKPKQREQKLIDKILTLSQDFYLVKEIEEKLSIPERSVRVVQSQLRRDGFLTLRRDGGVMISQIAYKKLHTLAKAQNLPIERFILEKL
jgi:Mn-dependent DtxR family transcriptional regulator